MITKNEELEYLAEAVKRAGTTPLEIVVPEDRYIVLRRMRFHYLDWGKAGATPIIFLHGGGLTAHTWDVVCLDFRSQYHCLALDQRGHGETEWSPALEYGVEAYVNDIEAFVDYLGVGEFVLVGMSLGGLNSIAYAGRHSERLKGLVIVDVGPDVREDGAKKIEDFMALNWELDSVDDFVERAIAFNPRRDPALLRRSLLYNLRQLPNGRWTWKYDRRKPPSWSPEVERVEQAQLWEDVRKIDCPTLVIRGQGSDVFYDEDAEKLAKHLPDGRWVRIRNAGHTVQGDNPLDLINAMEAFFRATQIQRGPE